MQRSASCRSRRELSNEYLLAKIGVDTAENEPLEVWGNISIHSSSAPSSVFVAAPPEECLRRRLARDTAERGRTAEGVQRQWDKQAPLIALPA